MLVKQNPDVVIGKTWSETSGLDWDWKDCYPIIAPNKERTDGEIIGILMLDEVGDSDYTPVEMRNGRFVEMAPEEVENGNPDAFTWRHHRPR